MRYITLFTNNINRFKLQFNTYILKNMLFTLNTPTNGKLIIYKPKIPFNEQWETKDFKK